MSFEKVKIIGVERLVSKKTGEVHHFLDVEILQSQRIYLNDTMIKNLPTYEQMKGKECLIPTVWQDYQGKPSLSLSEDGLPILLKNQQPINHTPVNHYPEESTIDPNLTRAHKRSDLAASLQPEEPAEKTPFFASSKK
jgi:hypothetical protein